MAPIKNSDKHLKNFGKRVKPYLPEKNERENFQKTVKKSLKKCQIENCPCEYEEFDDFDDEMIDNLFHSCAKSHHKRCQLLHTYVLIHVTD